MWLVTHDKTKQINRMIYKKLSQLQIFYEKDKRKTKNTKRQKTSNKRNWSCRSSKNLSIIRNNARAMKYTRIPLLSKLILLKKELQTKFWSKRDKNLLDNCWTKKDWRKVYTNSACDVVVLSQFGLI